ncbi:MAG: M13 family metallopeptidase, partial [Muribaculaceae bacterium]|nr:M13 family metallopeptidase [Muribaculaceae bacterium]
MKIKLLLSGICIGLCFAGANAQDAPKEHLKSLSAEGIDNSISPKKDFYSHVNKKWMEDHPLSAEYSRYGQFNILNDSSNNRVRRIVAGLAATNPAPGTDAYKIATLYEAGMDSVRRNALGATPIKKDLAKIENTPASGMTDLFLWMHKNYSSPLVDIAPMEDLANSNEYAMYVSGAGLGLGDRDYYLLNDKRNKDVRTAYTKLIETVMQLAGYSKKDAKRIAKNVLKIETLIADSTWTREESRNIPAMYNPRSIAQLKETYPAFPWDRFFVETMGIQTPEMFIVATPNTVLQGNALMNSLTDREKKDLYLWEYVSSAAPFLSDDFADASFEFQKVLSGVEQQHPRWKKALGTTEGIMGEGIGKLYVE